MIKFKRTGGHIFCLGIALHVAANLAVAQDITQVLLPPIDALKDQESVKAWQRMAQSLTNVVIANHVHREDGRQ